MKMLRSINDLEKLCLTVGELAKETYKDIDFDCAMPVDFLKYCLKKEFDPRGQIVVIYPKGYVMGIIAPLTIEADKFLVESEEIEPVWRNYL